MARAAAEVAAAQAASQAAAGQASIELAARTASRRQEVERVQRLSAAYNSYVDALNTCLCDTRDNLELYSMKKHAGSTRRGIDCSDTSCWPFTLTSLNPSLSQLFGVQNLAASRSLPRSTKALADAARCSLVTGLRACGGRTSRSSLPRRRGLWHERCHEG